MSDGQAEPTPDDSPYGRFLAARESLAWVTALRDEAAKAQEAAWCSYEDANDALSAAEDGCSTYAAEEREAYAEWRASEGTTL